MNALQVDCGALSPSPARLHAVRSARTPAPRRPGVLLVQDARAEPDGLDYVDGFILNGVHYFGGMLLGVSSEDELEFILSEFSGAEEFVEFHAHLTRLALRHSQVDQGGGEKLQARLTALFAGIDECGLIAECLRVLQLEERAAPAVLRQILAGTVRMPAGIASGSLYELLESISTPHEYVAAVRGAIRSNAAQLGLMEAEMRKEQGEEVPVWLLLALLSAVNEGNRAHLRLLAGMPGSDLSDADVPAVDRLDWDALVDRWELLARKLDAMHADAAASGRPVYFPLGDPGDT